MSWLDRTRRLADRCLAVLGNDVSINGIPCRGILKSPQEMVIDGAVFVLDHMLEVPASEWPAVSEAVLIVVDGVNYRARETGRLSPDGSTLLIPLAPVVTVGTAVFETGVYLDGVFAT